MHAGVIGYVRGVAAAQCVGVSRVPVVRETLSNCSGLRRMFLGGVSDGFALWVECKVYNREVVCQSNRGAVLIDVRGLRAELVSLLRIRHAVVHGKDSIRAVPEFIRPMEASWRDTAEWQEMSQRLSPVARFSLSSALNVIRLVRARISAAALADRARV